MSLATNQPMLHKDSLCTLKTTANQRNGSLQPQEEQEQTSGIGEGHTAKLLFSSGAMMLAAAVVGMAGADTLAKASRIGKVTG